MTRNGRPPHILVIDDSQEILDLLAELLAEEGYRVTTSQAHMNLERLKTLAPDAIVQDLLFAGTQLEGWRFLTLVRLDPELCRIPLVLCTAAVQTVKDPEMAAQLKQLGVRVVLKPFDIARLLSVLAELLATPSPIVMPLWEEQLSAR